MPAHGGKPVTCLDFINSGQTIITGGGDENLSIWDIRKWQVTQTIPANQRKYGETICCIATSKSTPAFASGGGDGIVRHFEYTIN